MSNNKEWSLKDILESLLTPDGRKQYQHISKNIKETNGFIINRYLSRRFLEFGFLMNPKQTDYSLVMDMWYLFLRKHISPDTIYFNKWVWPSKVKSDVEEIVPEDIMNILVHGYGHKLSDVSFMHKYLPEEFNYIVDEAKHFKKVYNQKA